MNVLSTACEEAGNVLLGGGLEGVDLLNSCAKRAGKTSTCRGGWRKSPAGGVNNVTQ